MNSIWSNNSNFITDNFFKLNHKQFKIYKVTLQPGNSLLIPPWWFHAVKGHDLSCSITKVYYRSDTTYLLKYPRLNLLDILNYYQFGLFELIYILVIVLIIFFIWYFKQKKLNMIKTF